jgi:hypothetical protein
MADKNFIVKVQRMNNLISREATGTPREFASRLNVAESTLYNYINCLKYDFNAPVAYCRYRRTYYYKNRGNILIGFTSLSNKEIIKVKGGYFRYPLYNKSFFAQTYWDKFGQFHIIG